MPEGSISEIGPANQATANKCVGSVIRAQRKKKGMTLHRLGDLADISEGALSQIERGVVAAHWGSLKRIAHGLDLSLDELFAAAEPTFPHISIHGVGTGSGRT